MLVDQLNQLSWGLGGGRGPEPKPVWRPWDDGDRRQTETFRGDSLTLAEADALAARFRPRKDPDGH
ncbi:hypothetical protein [Acidipropionibacterium timonense]|uniref:hypothetical protein n=1 Tax=Acidipropionibacterium timonense TaxID=2161818 RepID=UPI001030439E|nr:hypothetical protein [Acidipropionibacterium timonense]